MRVHHLALRTKRLAALVRFYRDVVGLRVVRAGARSVWLRAGATVVMIERARRDEPAVPRGALDLVCFAARSKKELAALRSRVRVEGETSYTFYFRDPDGRRVGFSRYRFPVTASSGRPRRRPAD